MHKLYDQDRTNIAKPCIKPETRSKLLRLTKETATKVLLRSMLNLQDNPEMGIERAIQAAMITGVTTTTLQPHSGSPTELNKFYKSRSFVL